MLSRQIVYPTDWAIIFWRKGRIYCMGALSRNFPYSWKISSNLQTNEVYWLVCRWRRMVPLVQSLVIVCSSHFITIFICKNYVNCPLFGSTKSRAITHVVKQLILWSEHPSCYTLPINQVWSLWMPVITFKIFPPKNKVLSKIRYYDQNRIRYY